MFELGKNTSIENPEVLVPIKNFFGRPIKMPVLSTDQTVVCGYNQGLGERLIVCESFDDMQKLYNAYMHGGAITISWYAVNLTELKLISNQSK